MNEVAQSVPDQDLLTQYGCGPIRFSGQDDALYERHLLFDDVVAPEAAGPRERFEAAARSVRDVLSQRWILTDSTYDRENPKRIYYLSMEFLIGRSLSNNITNLLLDPFVKQIADRKNLDPLDLIEQEPDAGLGNGGLGRLAACFLDSMATMQLPAMGYGLRYEYGIFKQTIQDGWQHEEPDNWLRRQDPWEVLPSERGRRGQTELLVRDAGRALAPCGGRILFTDRHTVRSTNRRLWRQDHQHIAPMGRGCAQLLRLSGIQQRRFCRRPGWDSRGRVADPRAISRRFHQHGTGPALRAGVFPGRLLIGRSRPALPPRQCRLEHVPRQGRDSAQRHASDDGGAGVDADPARRGASRLGPGLGSDAEDVGLHQSHPAARSAREMAACVVRDDAAAPFGDYLRNQSTFPQRLSGSAIPATRSGFSA